MVKDENRVASDSVPAGVAGGAAMTSDAPNTVERFGDADEEITAVAVDNEDNVYKMGFGVGAGVAGKAAAVAPFPPPPPPRDFKAMELDEKNHSFRLPNGELITSKNTLRSHTAHPIDTPNTNTNTSAAASESNRQDGEGTSAAILVNAYHALPQTTIPAPVQLVEVMADAIVSTGNLNDIAQAANRAKFQKKCIRMATVALIAVLLVAVTVFVTLYVTDSNNAGPTVDSNNNTAAPTTPQYRATKVTNYINSIKLSLGTLDLVATAAAFATTASPEEPALAWLVYDDPLQLVPDTSESQFQLRQRYALLTLLLQLPNYTLTMASSGGGYSSLHECDWVYVENCTVVTAATGSRAVTGLIAEIEGDSLEDGTVSTPQQPAGKLSPDLGLLSSLTAFLLKFPAGLGSLPESLAQWTDLEYFQGALAAESLPSSFGTSWSNLKMFDVRGNGWKGSIPSWIVTAPWTNLETFDVRYNALSGTLPASIGMARTNLKELYAGHNAFTGSVASTIGMTWAKLESLDMSDNALTGSLASSMGMAWTSLRYFGVSSNAMTGSLPSSLGSTWADLSHFGLSDNVLTGSLPSLLGTAWTKLANFDMSSNALVGSFPLIGMSWTILRWFDVSNNLLTGSLPSSIGTMWTNLSQFNVENNALTGSIPSSFVGWKNIESIYLVNNSFVGSMPSEFCNSTLAFVSVDCDEVTCECCTYCL